MGPFPFKPAHLEAQEAEGALPSSRASYNPQGLPLGNLLPTVSSHMLKTPAGDQVVKYMNLWVTFFHPNHDTEPFYHFKSVVSNALYKYTSVSTLVLVQSMGSFPNYFIPFGI